MPQPQQNDDQALARRRMDRLESRIEHLERDCKALLDVAALLVGCLGEHLRDRHDTVLQSDDAADSVMLRKARARVRKWLDESGNTAKAWEIREVIRTDENRSRPPKPEPPPVAAVPQVMRGAFATTLVLPSKPQEANNG